MDEDFEIEFENNPAEPADVVEDLGSEDSKVEEPVVDDKQAEPSDKSEEQDSLEEPSDKDNAKKDEPSNTPKFDEDLDEWALKAGHEAPENDRERKLLQNLRDGQREFTKDRQAKKGVDKLQDSIKSEVDAVDIKEDKPSDLTEARIAEIDKTLQSERANRLQSEFFISNNIDDAMAGVMGDIIKEKVAVKATPEDRLKVVNHWGHPDQLQDLYDLACARMEKANKEALANEAARKERERIANLSKGSGVNRSAKTTVPQDTKSDLDKLWED